MICKTPPKGGVSNGAPERDRDTDLPGVPEGAQNLERLLALKNGQPKRCDDDAA